MFPFGWFDMVFFVLGIFAEISAIFTRRRCRHIRRYIARHWLVGMRWPVGGVKKPFASLFFFSAMSVILLSLDSERNPSFIVHLYSCTVMSVLFELCLHAPEDEGRGLVLSGINQLVHHREMA